MHIQDKSQNVSGPSERHPNQYIHVPPAHLTDSGLKNVAYKIQQPKLCVHPVALQIHLISKIGLNHLCIQITSQLLAQLHNTRHRAWFLQPL
jgi:hypothetical protein